MINPLRERLCFGEDIGLSAVLTDHEEVDVRELVQLPDDRGTANRQPDNTRVPLEYRDCGIDDRGHPRWRTLQAKLPQPRKPNPQLA